MSQCHVKKRRKTGLLSCGSNVIAKITISCQNMNVLYSELMVCLKQNFDGRSP